MDALALMDRNIMPVPSSSGASIGSETCTGGRSELRRRNAAGLWAQDAHKARVLPRRCNVADPGGVMMEITRQHIWPEGSLMSAGAPCSRRTQHG